MPEDAAPLLVKAALLHRALHRKAQWCMTCLHGMPHLTEGPLLIFADPLPFLGQTLLSLSTREFHGLPWCSAVGDLAFLRKMKARDSFLPTYPQREGTFSASDALPGAGDVPNCALGRGQA